MKPIRDEQGRIWRLYSAATDIDDLREEIDKASMLEEIVGISPALQTALSRLSKVAATDATVLITGETGYRQGTDRQGYPPAVRTLVPCVCKRQLRRNPARFNRVRVVRP